MMQLSRRSDSYSCVHTHAFPFVQMAMMHLSWPAYESFSLCVKTNSTSYARDSHVLHMVRLGQIRIVIILGIIRNTYYTV